MFSRFTTQSILSKRMDILYMVSYSHIIICINQAIYVLIDRGEGFNKTNLFKDISYN